MPITSDTDPSPIDLAESTAPVSRRTMITAAAAAVGGAAIATLGPTILAGQAAQKAAAPVVPPVPPPPQVPADPTVVPGMPSEALGARSPFENPALTPTKMTTGSSLTPLQDLTGTITPSDLMFQRHHSGIALIDPQKYELMIHGLVDKPLVFSLADLKRFPAVTRIHFLECSGNGRTAYRSPKPEMTAQLVDGLLSNCEWTGVPLSTVLREVGVKSGAKWMLAEGGDAPKMTRSIPMEKVMDDALLVWAMNGEPLRAPNGYPVRLLLPGYEGNMNVKWLRRLELGTEPWMTRDETSHYTDPLPNGTARMFSFVMDAKSVITSPTKAGTLTGPGWYPISGLAWTGRGKITRVDVSTDSGKSWTQAELLGEVLTHAVTRFQLMWKWNGTPTRIMSRALDETGYAQPTLAEFRKIRGPGTDYHFNYVRAWDVKADGSVAFGVDA
jgi:sulfane dehydrogenase subunit SoxC